jgi:hypothetical protein
MLVDLVHFAGYPVRCVFDVVRDLVSSTAPVVTGAALRCGMAKALIHYELREFDGDHDLCRVNSSGIVIAIDAEIHNREILERVAAAFDAQIIPEGVRGTLPA